MFSMVTLLRKWLIYCKKKKSGRVVILTNIGEAVNVVAFDRPWIVEQLQHVVGCDRRG